MADTAKVYVSARGGHFVKPADLLSSTKGRQQIRGISEMLRSTGKRASTADAAPKAGITRKR